MAFEVTQGEFRGPLEVLLDLIEARKLHISDVTLSKVTADFLNYAKSHEGFPIAESAQFGFVASTLLLIKSKSLLPQLSLTREEEASMEDLERRLRLLQRFRELSRHVRARFGETPLYLPRERAALPVFAPPKEISPKILCRAVLAVLAAIPKTEKLATVAVQKVISLEEMIERLRNRVTLALKMSFVEFSKMHKGERIHVIVGFLAMLELVKQGLIAARQETRHGEIVMETNSIGTPRY